MGKDLSDWLEMEFYKSNIPKYHKYFKEWFNNIIEYQLDGFSKQMVGQITKNKQQ